MYAWFWALFGMHFVCRIASLKGFRLFCMDRGWDGDIGFGIIIGWIWIW